MKKLSIILLLGLMGLTLFAQRFNVTTNIGAPQNYKKHFSYSIEEGIENGQPRQFVVGNKTDWGLHSKFVTGQSFDGTNIVSGQQARSSDTIARVQLTDFCIYPSDNYQYGAGTGVYYPFGTSGMGYPFLAIYDKVTMTIIRAEYFILSYPGITGPANAVGLRIKYSHVANAFYISGVMADRLFEDINMNNIRGKSKGFILKVDPAGLNVPQVLLFTPDNLPNEPDEPLLCVVTDLEISADETKIAFTGITTKERFTKYHHPMVGMIDMNLNLLWCNAYKFSDVRYSGVDVTYDTTTNKLLVLMNSANEPFAVMELDTNGNITQNAVNYEFTEPASLSAGIARAQIMHYHNGGIMITGNCFVTGQTAGTTDQLLFSYKIADATNLQTGSNSYTYYSREVMPRGSQIPVTSYWTPENSIYQDGHLFITGILNNNNQSFGYTLINVDGMSNGPDCIDVADATVSAPLSVDKLECTATLSTCTKTDVYVDNLPNQPTPIIECNATKSAPAMEKNKEGMGELWKFNGIDAQGIHAVLFSENNNTVYHVNVYDVVGRKVYSSTYNVNDGQKEIYMKFTTKAQMYIIKISDGTRSKTLKVMGNR